MTQTHIDPFAPGDSPQHPANWGKLPVEDATENLFQWRRDNLVAATEADAELSAEELADRHERHADYLDEFGSPEEREDGAEFVPLPVLLRRAVYAELDEEQIDEWKALFELHSTDDERDDKWVEEVLPDLDELRARATVADLSARAAAEPTAPQELPVPPKGNALKEDWIEYALAVAKARGEELTAEQADALTVADLKARYKPQAD